MGLRNEHRGTREIFYKRNGSVLDGKKPMVICTSYEYFGMEKQKKDEKVK